MKTMLWQNKNDQQGVINLLKKNNILLCSTDTIMGLLASATPQSYRKLSSLKKRKPEKPYLLLVNSYEKLHHFVDTRNITRKIINLLTFCWPGPVTIVFKAKPDCQDHLVSSKGTIAIRCPQHTELLAILHSFDALFSTSANKTGQPVCQTLSQADPTLRQQIAGIIIDDEKHDARTKRTVPSSIIDVSTINSTARLDEQSIRVLRVGAFAIEELEKQYGQSFIT